MGTPSYAAPVLSDLVDAGYEVVGVYTQPDRAAGRGRRSVAPPVKLFAQENRLAVFQPKSLRAESARTQVRTLAPDIIVVAAYGLFLPREVLETPPRACLNIHPSLLPKYRGPSLFAGLSPTTLRHQIQRGVLPGKKIGRNWVVHWDHLDEYITNHSRKVKARRKALASLAR